MERPPVPRYAIVCGARGDCHAAGLDLGLALAVADHADLAVGTDGLEVVRAHGEALARRVEGSRGRRRSGGSGR